MSRITEELIRKKAEHHDGLLAELEELSLHQLELERIEVVGTLCRKLRILYLQNNIIPRLENLQHLKDLRYLNVALNNITKLEGLSSCEFLNKLDLTVNFIDVDALEESVEHLASLLHLRELYLMGNPCLEWGGANKFIVASLPQLERLDGKDITRKDRIEALQEYRTLLAELRVLAAKKREEKGVAAVAAAIEAAPAAAGAASGGASTVGAKPSSSGGGDGDDDDDETSAWTPEARVKMYRELAESKAEQEARKREMEPKKRDYKAEQAEAVETTRAKESAGSVRQTNEGRWDFSLEEEDGAGNLVVRLQLSKYLDSSLVDVDVHPLYVSVIIKGKVFRLAFPDEVLPSRSKCQRSQTTGELMITAPKLKPNAILAAVRSREKAGVADGGAGLSSSDGASSSAAGSTSAPSLALASSTASSAAGGRGGVAASSASAGIPAFGSAAAAAGASARAGAGAAGKRGTVAASGSARVTMLAKPSSLADELLEATKAVSICGIVAPAGKDPGASSSGGGGGGDDYVPAADGSGGSTLLRAGATTVYDASVTADGTGTRRAAAALPPPSTASMGKQPSPGFVDDDEVPPLE